MFEARLPNASIFKKIIASIQELLADANFDCSASGIALQSMDSSHVSLVAVLLRADGFEHFRCDRAVTLGHNMKNLANVLKCSDNNDIITIKAEDDAQVATYMFESPSQSRVSDVEMKLINIDVEHLGIPETSYDAIVTMPSTEFQRIVRDLQVMGDTVVISVSKDNVKFSFQGDNQSGNVTLRATSSIDKPEESVEINLQENVQLTFALRYLNFFTKATPLSDQVTISMSKDTPLVVEYRIQDLGYVRYYLAPKIEEDDD
eukprot:GCRY01000559.1.p1 GENE.GCRY01000559.1~~GCRY01000559.1.p1  ORF type:complete len:261 (+),score=85.51 GCRY01000559.1:127-909(+)